LIIREKIEMLARACVHTLPMLLALCALLSSSASASDQGDHLPLSAFPLERIAVETRSSFRRHLFEAWRADSPRKRAQGFMFVPETEVRPDQAMIFPYDPPQYVAMWMKNTLLPLDMLFVDRRGCIVNIIERAKPGSLAQIGSGAPVALVVELKAGIVAQSGIRTGDRVLRLDAGWPREDASCGGPPSP
jgi:hypothetical protein